MSALSATEIAFAGLRLIRERPRAMLLWTGLNLLLALVSTAVLIPLAGPQLAEFMNLRQSGERPEPEAVYSAFGRIGPAFLLMLPLMFAYFGVIAAGVNRLVILRETAAWHGLALGNDELRQISLFLILILLMIAAYVPLLVAVLLTIVVGIAIRLITGSLVVAILAAVVCIVLGLAAFIYVMVRLSLAGPLTFSERRVRVFRSWTLTRGRFWPLFGGYLLVGVLIMLVSLLSMMILGGIGLATGGLAGAGAAFNPDFTSFRTYFTPAVAASLPVSAFVNVLTAAMAGGAAAEAYRQITDAEQPPQPAD